jgi:hypothetical protein
MILEIVFGVSYVGQLLILAWGLSEVRRFVARTPAIADDASLARYKALVRTQMYMALVVVCLMIPGLVATAMLVFRYDLAGLGVVLVANAFAFVAGQHLRKWEARARSLPVTAEPLGPEYTRVSTVWIKKPFPDFQAG